jgi:ABC-type glycerol-3-phosphate transport system substrate-binding protein
MKEKFFKSMLIMAALAMVLSACAPAATQAPAAAPQAPAAVAPTAATAAISGTITWLNHRTDMDTDGGLAKLVAAFNKIYPNVTVKWETMTDYDGDVQTRMKTTDYGDVLMIPSPLTADKYADFFSPLGTVKNTCSSTMVRTTAPSTAYPSPEMPRAWSITKMSSKRLALPPCPRPPKSSRPIWD